MTTTSTATQTLSDTDLAIQVIRDLTDPTSGWASVADFREAFDGYLTRTQQDELMTSLAMGQAAMVIPVANLKSLTQRDRDAALTYGGRLTHAIRIL